MRIAFGPQTVTDLEAGSAREWLVADGLGGYAMGTVNGLRTRRYHGVLVISTDPPRQRRLALASLDPVVVIGDERVRLATHEWRSGAIDPAGHVHRTAFALIDGVPTWRWSVGPVVLEAELAMAHGRSAVGVVYRCLATDRPVTVEIEALCTWRDIDGETDTATDPVVAHDAGGFVFADAYRVSGPGWAPGGDWYRDVHHRVEAERGLRADEDLWFAGRFTAVLAAGDAIDVAAWSLLDDAHRTPPPPVPAIVAAAHARARALVTAAGVDDDIDAALVRAADQFVAADSVVAGYPWFGDWSRDTLVSYSGLFLATRRAGDGRRVLQRIAATLDHGLLANTVDHGARRDNAADAPLWFVRAVRAHLDATGDTDLAAELRPAIESIVDAYLSGTRFGIGVGAEGLVHIGQSGEALTWMDARIDGVPVTERAGCPVEINALWVSALASLARVQRAVRIDDAAARALYVRACTAFAAFRIGDGLADVWRSGGSDTTRRPNQLLAAALPDTPLHGDQVRLVLDACTPLVTPLGLRSLAPDEPHYAGRHRGGPAARDRAYHQGTVWPWLIGAYADAVFRVDPTVDGGHRNLLANMLDTLGEHVGEFGLGSISETFDGDAPNEATGCPFQAWSVAEVLRARRRLATHRP